MLTLRTNKNRISVTQISETEPATFVSSPDSKPLIHHYKISIRHLTRTDYVKSQSYVLTCLHRSTCILIRWRISALFFTLLRGRDIRHQWVDFVHNRSFAGQVQFNGLVFECAEVKPNVCFSINNFYLSSYVLNKDFEMRQSEKTSQFFLHYN